MKKNVNIKNENIDDEPRGIPIRDFTWNEDNRMTEAVNYGTGHVYYQYDALGRRIKRSDPDSLRVSLELLEFGVRLTQQYHENRSLFLISSTMISKFLSEPTRST